MRARGCRYGNGVAHLLEHYEVEKVHRTKNAGYNNDFTSRGSKEISFAPQKMLASNEFRNGLIKLF